MRIKRLIIIFGILILSVGLFGRTATTADQPLSRNWDMKWHNANQVTMPITNYGVFGQDVRYTDSGTYWPSAYPNETYIFGAGLWVGAIKISMGAPDTLVTCGYNPNSAGHEFVPGPTPDKMNDPDQIVYMSDSDNDGYGWPLKTTEGSDSVVSIQDSWCVYNDMDPTYHFVPENHPLNLRVEQTGYVWVGPLKEDIVFLIFRVFNDGTDTLRQVYMAACADCDVGDERTGNDLLGFDPARKLAYQFQIDDETGWHDHPGIIGFRFLESPKATDTVTVMLPDSSIDTIYPGEQLGMTSFNFFTIDIDPSNKIERYLALAGYDFKNFDPNNPQSSYRPWPNNWTQHSTPNDTLSPYYYEEDPSLAGDKRFLQSSGPFDLYPGDSAQIVYAIILATYTEDRSSIRTKSDMAQMIYDAGWIGPTPPVSPNLTVVPGFEKVTLYWDNIAEITEDKYYKYASDSINYPDLYNPIYRQYDFEGYKVWKSTDGVNWEKLDQYDLKDGVTTMPLESLMDPTADTAIYTKIETLGFDTGLQYMYVDSGLTTGVTYYYAVTAYDWNYAETDPNGMKIFLESSPKGNMVAITPHGIGDNVAPAMVSDVNDPSSGIWDMTFNVIDPSSDLFAEENTINIKWQYPEVSPYADYRFKGYIYVNDETDPEDSIFIDVVNNAGQIVLWNYSINSGGDTIYTPIQKEFRGGMFEVKNIDFNATDILDYPNPDTFAKAAEKGLVTYGDYNPANGMLVIKSTADPVYKKSGKYKIIWHDTGDNRLTAEVWDITDTLNPVQLPFNGDEWGIGWSFGVLNNTIVDTIADGDEGAKGMYINGVVWYFNSSVASSRVAQPMDWTQKPADGEEWTLTIGMRTTEYDSTDASLIEWAMDVDTTVDSETGDTIIDTTVTYISLNKGMLPVTGVVSSYTITPTTFETAEETVDSLLENVKVVPNPYVVRNEMEISEYSSKLLFTHLPARCLIRIYTVDGELVRILNHNDPTSNTEVWDLLTASGARIASGVYVYHIEALDENGNRIGTKVGKFAVIK